MTLPVIFFQRAELYLLYYFLSVNMAMKPVISDNIAYVMCSCGRLSFREDGWATHHKKCVDSIKKARFFYCSDPVCPHGFVDRGHAGFREFKERHLACLAKGNRVEAHRDLAEQWFSVVVSYLTVYFRRRNHYFHNVMF